MSERCPLADLPMGTHAIVRDVRCDRTVRRRLLELGLLPGTPIQLVRRAPLGDPIELRLRGYALSIRREDASAVEVEVTSAVSPAPTALRASVGEKELT